MPGCSWRGGEEFTRGCMSLIVLAFRNDTEPRPFRVSRGISAQMSEMRRAQIEDRRLLRQNDVGNRSTCDERRINVLRLAVLDRQVTQYRLP